MPIERGSAGRIPKKRAANQATVDEEHGLWAILRPINNPVKDYTQKKTQQISGDNILRIAFARV